MRPAGPAAPTRSTGPARPAHPEATGPRHHAPGSDPHDASPEILMRARGLEMSFGQTRALRGIDLDVVTGEVLAVTGPSGSGKSTLLHVMAGVLVPDAGSVHYSSAAEARGGASRAGESGDAAAGTGRSARPGRSGGASTSGGNGGPRRGSGTGATSGTTSADTTTLDITTLDEAARSRLRLREFGFIFQYGQLLPDLSALDNVTLPLLLAGTPRRKALEMSRQTLDELGLSEHMNKLPGQMSGGQAQRVAVARSLVTSPRLIFADEPTGSLDSLAAERTMETLLRSVRARGASMLVITHDPRTAAYADREVTVRDGRISAEATLEDTAASTSRTTSSHPSASPGGTALGSGPAPLPGSPAGRTASSRTTPGTTAPGGTAPSEVR